MKLGNLRIGEGLLWLGFVGFAVGAQGRKVEDAVSLGGLCVLAAIGVRATRPEVAERSDGEV